MHFTLDHSNYVAGAPCHLCQKVKC